MKTQAYNISPRTILPEGYLVYWRKLYGGVIYKQRIPVSILVKHNKHKNMSNTTTVTIKPPNFQRATFKIVGAAPLVIHRFSKKALGIGEPPKAPGEKRKKKVTNPEAEFNAGRYISHDGWDGFHAAAIRNAMISACRLCNYKIVLAKLSVFAEADGWDAKEPQIPLIRIYGEPVMQHDIGRVATGQPYPLYRPAYHDWSANIRIRWDGDQFTLQDVSNLLSRAGMQVGIGEGRPDSKRSAGCGWGLFTLEA